MVSFDMIHKPSLLNQQLVLSGNEGIAKKKKSKWSFIFSFLDITNVEEDFRIACFFEIGLIPLITTMSSSASFHLQSRHDPGLRGQFESEVLRERWCRENSKIADIYKHRSVRRFTICHFV